MKQDLRVAYTFFHRDIYRKRNEINRKMAIAANYGQIKMQSIMLDGHTKEKQKKKKDFSDIRAQNNAR